MKVRGEEGEEEDDRGGNCVCVNVKEEGLSHLLSFPAVS